MSLPHGYQLVREIHASPAHRLVEAKHNAQRFALRVLTPEYRSVLDPVQVIERFGAIQQGLELPRLAEFSGAGAHDEGFWIAERWASGKPLAGVAWSELRPALTPLLDDLIRLHDARKWHGGIRPARLLWGDGKLVLTGYTFASWISTSIRTLRDELDPGATFPPELDDGPAGAGTALDVYDLSQALLAQVTALPPKVKQTLERGLSRDLAARPRLKDLRAQV